MPPLLSAEQVAAYDRDGFVKCDNWLDCDEVLQLLSIAKADKAFTGAGRDLLDDAGNVSRLSLRMWELPDDSYSAFVRHEALVRPIEQLLGDSVYHYHHKLMLKEPHTGGAWEWQCVPRTTHRKLQTTLPTPVLLAFCCANPRSLLAVSEPPACCSQDYGYWYTNFLTSDLASCMIALDRSTKANGCLKVLKGSHKAERISHGPVGVGQTGADPARVALLQEQGHLEVVHCEMEPGSVLFFHSNLLHSSAPNRSPHSRWSLICCYGACDNPPLAHHAEPDGAPDPRLTVGLSTEEGRFACLDVWDEATRCATMAAHGERLGLVSTGSESVVAKL